MDETYWKQLQSTITGTKTNQIPNHQDNCKLGEENHQTRRKTQDPIETLADAIFRYMNWQSYQLQLKEERRQNRFRKVYWNKVVETKRDLC